MNILGAWYGIVIIVWSTILIFILHIKTQVYDKHIVIDGLWTSRLVKIDLRRTYIETRTKFISSQNCTDRAKGHGLAVEEESTYCPDTDFHLKMEKQKVTSLPTGVICEKLFYARR